MPCSLESLANNLSEEQFKELRKSFTSKEDFIRLKRKGIFPYDYMTSFECLNLTSLPTRDKFYNALTDRSVLNED